MCSCLPTLSMVIIHSHRHPHQRSLAPPVLCPCPSTRPHTHFPHTLQEYLDVVQNRTKEKRYTFDVAFDPTVRGTTDGNMAGRWWGGIGRRFSADLRSSYKGVACQ